MNEIPTAEEFLNKNYFHIKTDLNKTDSYINIQDIYEAMIEFTKLHVEAALKTCHEYYEVNYDIYPFPDNEINVETDIYPLENIK